MKPVPSTHGAPGFDPWRRHLRPLEPGASQPPCSILVNIVTVLSEYLGQKRHSLSPLSPRCYRNYLIIK